MVNRACSPNKIPQNPRLSKTPKTLDPLKNPQNLTVSPPTATTATSPMALNALRLRRALSTLSSLHHRHHHHGSLSTFPILPSFPVSTPTASPPKPQFPPALLLQARSFRSSSISLSPSRPTNKFNEHDTIDPNTILFEGCDYNHWLITMDFPKDPAPTREEMIATYEKTCAQGLNISIEEAKTKIYACSTTTYQGFQALMTEKESENFKGIQGVVFILPDSYIDPQNKEYGGDKYVNGEIFPRPPPIQARQRGRYRDGNRNPDQPRYDRQDGPMPNRQGNTPYGQQGSMQGDGRNYGAPPNYSPQQNYGQPGSMQGDGRNYGTPQNYSPQQNYGQPGSMQGDGRNYGAPPNYSPQQNYGPPGQRERRDFIPPNNRDFPQGDRRDYAPPGQGDFRGDNRNFAPTHGQGDLRGDNRNFAPTQGGTYGQGAGGHYGHGTGGAYGPGQSFSGNGEGQTFSQVEQRNAQGEQRNNPPFGQTGTEQGRY